MFSRSSFAIGIFMGLIACSNQREIVKLIAPLAGSYYFATVAEGQASVQENCSSKTGNRVRIEFSNDLYMLFIDYDTTTVYIIKSAEANGSEVIVEVAPQIVTNAHVESGLLTIRFLKGDFLQITMANLKTMLVPIDEPEKFIYHSCEDAMLKESGESVGQIEIEMPQIDQSTLDGRVLAEVFRFLDRQQTHPMYFLEGHYIMAETPGPGLYPVQDTIRNENELSEFMADWFSNYPPEFLSELYNRKLVFFGEESHKCEPERKGLFISVHHSEQSGQTTATVSLVEDAGEPMTAFILNFRWDENNNIIPIKIDATDCSG